MSLKEFLIKYVNGEIDAISAIRSLSGAFNPDHATDILVIVCQITRIEQGDLTKEDFKNIWLKDEEQTEEGES